MSVSLGRSSQLRVCLWRMWCGIISQEGTQWSGVKGNRVSTDNTIAGEDPEARLPVRQDNVRGATIAASDLVRQTSRRAIQEGLTDGMDHYLQVGWEKRGRPRNASQEEVAALLVETSRVEGRREVGV